jgi:hypothetical protein
LGFHEYAEYSLIRNTPTSTLRALPMGRVEVQGTVLSGINEDFLESPFTRTSCVGYECRVQKYVHNDDGGNWQTKYSNRVTVPFVIEDETGRAAVASGDAEWALGNYDYRKRFDLDETPQPIHNFVKEKVFGGADEG